jgi:ribonuclease HII
MTTIMDGIIDSKQITNEHHREELYHTISRSDHTNAIPTIRYAVAMISPAIIDRINILQATLYGMRLVTSTLMGYGTIPKRHYDSK